jgi:RNA polymerase sigma factor (sigma-70 family)
VSAPVNVVPPADAELRDLVDQIQRGDAAAETRFYERFGPRVQYLAWRELRSPMHADDVRSESMMRALVAIREGRLRSPAALPAFVLQTARNVIREFARRDRRFVSLDEPGSAEPQAAPIEPADPGAVRALRVAIDGLGARDRAFLRMHYYDELPRVEIARRLGITEDRVRLIKSRAIQRFREAYAQVIAQ